MKLKTILFVVLTALLAVGFFACADTQQESEQGYHFNIHKQEYPLATFFSITSDDSYPGVVKKSVFRFRTNYDLSDRHGWQASGIKRIGSLGSFYPWATEIDIYDTRWEWMGMIDGQAVSTAAARFSIYDADSQLVGIAYLDHTLRTYTITYPNSEAYPIAQLIRNYDPKGQDSWSAIVYDPDPIDERIIRIFAAMACDLQDVLDEYYAPKNDTID